MSEIRMDVDPRRDGAYRVQVLAMRGALIEVQHNGQPVNVERQPGHPGPFFAQHAQEVMAQLDDTVTIFCGSEQCVVRIEKPLPVIVGGGLEIAQYFNGMDYPGLLANDEELREIMFLKQRELIKK